MWSKVRQEYGRMRRCKTRLEKPCIRHTPISVVSGSRWSKELGSRLNKQHLSEAFNFWLVSHRFPVAWQSAEPPSSPPDIASLRPARQVLASSCSMICGKFEAVRAKRLGSLPNLGTQLRCLLRSDPLLLPFSAIFCHFRPFPPLPSKF